MRKEDELKLLNTYNKTLEEENKAKSKQIKLLRQNLEKSVTLQISEVKPIISNQLPCLDCKSKDSYIENLNQSITDLKENHLTEIKKINSIKEETKTMQNDSRPSEVVSAELQTLKKNYDELKLEVEQSQQAVWKTIKTDANSMEQNRSQILVLKEDYQALNNKIKVLQAKLTQQQNSTLSNNEAETPNFLPLSMTSNTNPEYAQQTFQSQQLAKTVPSQTSNVPQQMRNSFSTHHRSQSTVQPMQFRKFQSPSVVRRIPIEDCCGETCALNYVRAQPYHSHSYVSAFPSYVRSDYPVSSSTCRTFPINFGKPNNECSQLPQISAIKGKVNNVTSKFEFNGSLIEGEWRTLNKKIRELEEINERLRCRVNQNQR